MKTKDFDSFPRTSVQPGKRHRRHAGGMGIGTALLGVACVAGMFALLTVLFHFG